MTRRARAAARPGAVMALALGLALGLAGPGTARAKDAAAAIHEDAEPPRLTPRQIYDRVLENRVDSFFQLVELRSGDAQGRIQTMKLEVYWQDFRDENDEPVDGILSKGRVIYTEPFDLRHYSYLLIRRDREVDDQFAYFPSFRKARRVNLRKQAIFGTDFSVDDVIPAELQDSDYRRLPDEVVDGVPAYVIEGIPRSGSTSAYSRFLIHVDRTRFVPLQTRYWNDAGVEVKELKVDVDSIRRAGPMWLPMRATMRDLRLDTFTTLEILDFVPNPEFDEATFEAGRLNASH